MRHTRTALGAALVTLAILAAACGGSSAKTNVGGSSPKTNPGAPTQTTSKHSGGWG